MAFSGEPWRGAARADVFVTALPANRHSAWVTTTVGSAQPTTDQATWEGNPGDAITLRFKWQSEGTGSAQQAPNFAIVEARLPGGVAVFTNRWDLSSTGDDAFPAAGVEVSRILHFDDDPLNFALGAIRSGMLELYLTWGSTGGIAPWSINSRSSGNTGVLVTNTADNARGYVRSNCIVTNDPAPSNVSIGGASPATFAFPDPVHTRITLSAVKYRSVALELEMLRTGTSTVERESTLSAQTAANHDFSWTATGTSGASRISFGIFPNDNTSPAEAKDLRIKQSALDFGGDNEYAWATTGHAAGWTFDSALQLTNASEMTVDPRLYPTAGAFSEWALDHGALIYKQATGVEFLDPPGLGDDDPGQRAFPDVGYLSVRYMNARGEGQDGLSVTLKIWDAAGITGTESSPTHTFSGTTRTSRDPPPGVVFPEAGWLPRAASGADENKMPLVWSTVASGTWRVKSVATAPADVVGLEAYPLESGADEWNRNVFFVAGNPNYGAIASIHPEDVGRHGTHLTPDDELVVFGYLMDHVNHSLVEMNETNGDGFHIILTREHHPTGRLDYFDFVSSTWVAKPDGGSMTDLALVRASDMIVGGDPDLWMTQNPLGNEIFTADPEAGEFDFTIIIDATKDGVHYTASIQVSLVDKMFPHNATRESQIPFDPEDSLFVASIPGTAQATLDSHEIVGTGTDFTLLERGMLIEFDSEGVEYTVRRIVDATHMSIIERYAGTTGSGKSMTRHGTGHAHLGSADSSAAIGDRS